jgi:PKD repeat protein
MKRIFTFLAILLSLTSLQTHAQISCNPAFTFVFVNNSTVKFTPINLNDSSYTQHTWTFGDGSLTSNQYSPTHTYASSGVFTVKHKKTYVTPNGIFTCADSTTQVITIANTTCNLNASFYFVATATNPLTHSYFNTSTNFTPGDSIRWNFGDGTVSYDQNPTHTFANAGVYNVCLRVKKQILGSTIPCVSEICKLDTVGVACNIQAYFTNTTVASTPASTIQFTNQSVGAVAADSTIWTFGDGTTSTSPNPTHTYTNAGTYTVCLKIKRNSNMAGFPPCQSIYCKTIVISPTTPTCNLAANFTWYRDSLATSPYTYHFTNTSLPFSNTDSIKWTFGDGTSSNQINPNHTYAQPGNYVVCVRIIKRNVNGTLSNCVAEKCNTVAVPLHCNITAAYSYTAAAGNYKTLIFTNTTALAGTSYTAFWSFGDGTSATGWNTTHTYANAGTYTVCLTVQLGNCTNTKCSTVTITAPVTPCTQLANYSFVRSATNNNTITFTPNNIDPTVQYTWTFGDGTGAVTPTSTHTFAAIGYYTVCLTAYKNNSCASTVCKSVYVSSTANCSLNNVWFNTQVDSLVPNRITFLAQSPTAILSQQWTIRKLPQTAANGTTTINSNNPTYVFLDSGNYRVCIKATFAGGCVKEYCSDIHVAQNMPFTTTCNLQVYPNPASTVANVSITLAQPTVLYAYVYNSMNMLVAQKVQQGFVGTNTVSVVTANLPSGIYRFRLVHGNNVCYATFVK